ncbi:MAG: tetratricopeptide repeat protein [Bacteroidota bacterium]
MRITNTVIIITSLSIFVSCKSEKEKLTEQIKSNESLLFNDTTKMLNPKIANDELAAYRKFADAYPEDSASAGYLFKAADLAHGMRKSHDAVSIYKDFISRYPKNNKIAAGYFLLAFVYDNDLKQKDSAKIFYREFLEKFPTHQLAPSAKASLDQIEMGLTDEELVKMFEARLDSTKRK